MERNKTRSSGVAAVTEGSITRTPHISTLPTVPNGRLPAIRMRAKMAGRHGAILLIHPPKQAFFILPVVGKNVI
jgi:hypothetical protein